MTTCSKCQTEYPSVDGYFYRRTNGHIMRPCKACIKEKSNKRYSEKADQINRARVERMATDAAYREKKRLADAASYLKHKAARLVSQKEYLSRPDVKLRVSNYFKSLRTNPDFLANKKQYLRKYHAALVADKDMREKLREKSRLYARNNPEKIKAHTRNRRARLRGSTGQHTAQDVLNKLQEQGSACFYCGCDVTGKHTVDHYIPVAKGGSNGPENIVIACQKCNYSKQDKLPGEFFEYLQEVSILS